VRAPRAIIVEIKRAPATADTVDGLCWHASSHRGIRRRHDLVFGVGAARTGSRENPEADIAADRAIEGAPRRAGVGEEDRCLGFLPTTSPRPAGSSGRRRGGIDRHPVTRSTPRR
jgi:hypothetical protein